MFTVIPIIHPHAHQPFSNEIKALLDRPTDPLRSGWVWPVAGQIIFHLFSPFGGDEAFISKVTD